MRLFFGLEPERKTTQDITHWRDRHLPSTGRPVPPANFHITLAFIGDISGRNRQHLEQLVQLTDERINQTPTRGGELILDTPGYWPKPGICWLGPDAGSPEPLQNLSGMLRQLGKSVGAKRDRNAFRPHITLYRGCEQPPPAATLEPKIPFRYSHFCLYESVQGRGGVRYQALESWELGWRR